MKKLILIAHNLRSCHNVGSLLRTAEGLGVSMVVLSGYTPYPAHSNDTRLPHESIKINKQIIKTSLGAEKTIDWEHHNDITELIKKLQKDGFEIWGLEQTEKSVNLPEFAPPKKLALIIGRELEGIEENIIELCKGTVEIPMFGKKESFNVAAAAAIALYHCTFK